MPTRVDIEKEIHTLNSTGQDQVRRRYLADLNRLTSNDTIFYASAFASKKLPQVPGFLVSITTEDIQGFMAALHGLKGNSLDLLLHSPGGSLEATDQIVQYLRSKYDRIRAIVPQNAMSAATMLACACDEIVMGKHSAIGPIDPQITFPTPHGHFTAPAQSILDEFAKAREEVVSNPKTAPLWVAKIRDYPPGFLKICESTLALSVDKVTEWLDAYMFRHVAPAERHSRQIAEWLGNAQEHKTHGRPIGLQKAKEIGLNVTPLEDDQELQEQVLSVFHAAAITLERTNCMKFVENHIGRGWFLNAKLEAPAH